MIQVICLAAWKNLVHDVLVAASDVMISRTTHIFLTHSVFEGTLSIYAFLLKTKYLTLFTNKSYMIDSNPSYALVTAIFKAPKISFGTLFIQAFALNTSVNAVFTLF